MTVVNWAEYTIPQLKKMLVEAGYEKASLAGLSAVELVDLIEKDEDPSLDEAELDEDYEEQEQEEKRTPMLPNQPLRSSPEWNEFVMKQFTDDERVSFTGKDGKKIDAIKADGLRRVGELVLGPVVSSRPVDNHFGFDGKGLPYAWARYEIVINTMEGPKQYGALGDVNWLNTDDFFLGFASTTAETRAKGRAWREALGVRTYASEEFAGKKNIEELVQKTTADWDGKAELSCAQAKTIGNICKKLGLSVFNILNMNKDYKYDGVKRRYSGLDDDSLTSSNGQNIIKILNGMQQGTIPVDESIKEKE